MENKNNILISIIIPTYNRAAILEKNLQSFIDQDFEKGNFELIVIDDGSTDQTKKAVRELIDQNSEKNIYYYYQKNTGPAVARNLGISKAKGKIVAFSDDDCVADRHWLKEIELSFKDEIVGVSGKIVALKDKATAFTHQIDSDEPNAFPAGNVGYLKDALEKVDGFDKNLRFTNEDNELATAIGKIGTLSHNSKMIVYDPPKKMGIRDIKGVIYLESVFLIVHKHPEIYKGFRHNPWLDIYWKWFIKLFIIQSIKGLKFFWKNPFDYLKLLILLIAQRIYLIILIPYFLKISRRCR